MSTDETLQLVQEQPDALLACILDMGEILLTSGAEILRVEDTLSRLCAAYGFRHINVFSVTSAIILTVQCADGRITTQTRRIAVRNTNLQKIFLVNSLSRQLCKKPIPVADFLQRLEQIRLAKSNARPLLCFCYAIISAVFAVFFGGCFSDAIAAAVSGVLVFVLQQFMGKLRMNDILQCLIISAFTAFAVVLLVRVGIGQAPEKITIGNIMLLIPGISFTTSLRDMINGDTISGLVGLCESVIKAMAIAIGFAMVLVQFGGAL